MSSDSQLGIEAVLNAFYFYVPFDQFLLQIVKSPQDYLITLNIIRNRNQFIYSHATSF